MARSELLTVEQAAAEFGIHRTTVFRWISEGKLPKHVWMGNRHTYVDRWDVQRLTDPPAVARCLELIYQRFTTTGEWPTGRKVQRELDQEDGPTFDFLGALEALPQELGWRMRDNEGQAQLTLRGIARCENSAADVNAFLAVIRLCYERYVTADGDLRITSSDAAATLAVDALMLKKLHKIMQIEGGWWYSLGGGPEGWAVEVDGERIRHFRDVESVSDYLTAKGRAFQPVAPLKIQWQGQSQSQPDEPHAAMLEAFSLLRDQHYVEAVMASATALERFMRARIGERPKRIGKDLVDAFFAKAQRVGHPDPQRLAALRSIMLGTLGAFRNPAAHGRLEVTAAQAREIVSLFSLLARETEMVLQIQQKQDWVPYGEATMELRQAFSSAGLRRRLLAFADPQKLPDDWYCEEEGEYIHPTDLGVTYGEGIEADPVCPHTGCQARGWERVHPLLPKVSAGGAPGWPIFTRLPKNTDKT